MAATACRFQLPTGEIMADYRTMDEIVFIENLGRRSKSRLELLRTYESALGKRANWDGMQKDYVMACIEDEIKRAKRSV